MFHESWASAFDAQMPIPGGYMWAKNDAQYLYVALDMIDDPNNDPGTGSVGLIPTTKIDSNGRASTDPGYYLVVRNAAFGRTINLIANGMRLSALWAANARKYKVLHRSGTSGSFQPLESGWKNYLWNGSDYVLQSFSMHAGFYYMVNPAVDYSIDDLLMGPSWAGQHNIIAPGSGVWVPPDQCAYTFEAWVHARTTNGYAWVGSNRAHKSITVMK